MTKNFYEIFYEIRETEVDERGQNKNLRYHIVDKDIMESLGFRHISNVWMFCKCMNNIGIYIRITDDCVGTIDVLDDYFCQPYDFQYMIQKYKDKAPKVAIEVQHKLYSILDSMKTFGILENWEWGDYV